MGEAKRRKANISPPWEADVASMVSSIAQEAQDVTALSTEECVRLVEDADAFTVIGISPTNDAKKPWRAHLLRGTPVFENGNVRNVAVFRFATSAASSKVKEMCRRRERETKSAAIRRWATEGSGGSVMPGSPTITPEDLTRITADPEQTKLFLDEIVREGAVIVTRPFGCSFRGPTNGVVVGFSDDPGAIRDCLLWRLAQEGEANAMTVLTKIPCLRIFAATGEERAINESGGVLENRTHSGKGVDVRFDYGTARGHVINRLKDEGFPELAAQVEAGMSWPDSTVVRPRH
jgi:hypothetical protein